MKTDLFDEDSTTPELIGRIARLRKQVAQIDPPATIEAQLQARIFGSAVATAAIRGRSPARPATPAPIGVRSTRAPRRWAERWAAALAWPVSVTATAGLVSWIVYTNPAISPEPVERIEPSAASLATADPIAATPFMALTSLDEIPGGRNRVVATTLPRTTLAEFGLPVSPMRAAEPIRAEFLIGANGGVLAVRFVDGADR